MQEQTVDAGMMNDLFSESPIGSVSQEDWRKYIQYITEDKSIPENIKNLFWAFSDKENVLSNLKEEDIRRIMNDLEICYNFEIMKMPPYKYSFQIEQQFWQFKAKLLLKLKRSQDGFERKAQMTQVKELHTDSNQQQNRGGVVGTISRLLGR